MSPDVNSSSTSESSEKSPQYFSFSINELPKWTTVAVVFIYATGYLITSLNDFRYGYSDMNPLRPRIIAAGAWFSVFTFVPFLIILEAKRRFTDKVKGYNIDNFLQISLSYLVVAIFLAFLSIPLFQFDNGITTYRTPWWLVVDIVLVVVSILISTISSIKKDGSRLLQLINTGTVIGIFVVNLAATFHDLFAIKTFTPNAPGFWVVMAGVIIGAHMWNYESKLHTHKLRNLIFAYFVLISFFAEFYYPHIHRKWGGGASIQIELTLSKDAPIHAGQSVTCFLLDETELGLFVLGKGDKHATFIPRSEVSLVFYGEGAELSDFNRIVVASPQ